jgi:hypothetical protein
MPEAEVEIGNALCRLLADPVPSAVSDDDWQQLSHRARVEGVAPLLHSRLRAAGVAEEVPEPARTELQRAYYQAAAVNTRVYHVIPPLLQALRGAGISVLALKGIYLAEHVYSNIASRPVGDIDLLVPPDQLTRAAQVLDGAGCTIPVPYVWQSARIAATHHHLAPRQLPGGETWVELHRDLAPPALAVDMDLAGVWDRAAPTQVGGVEVQAMAMVDLLRHLCVHTAGTDLFANGLRPLADITAVLEAEATTWAQLVDGAPALERPLAVAIHAAARLLAAPLPPDMPGLAADAAAAVEAAAGFLLAGAVTTPAADRVAGLAAPARGTLRARLGEACSLGYGRPLPYLRHNMATAWRWLRDHGNISMGSHRATASGLAAGQRAAIARFVRADGGLT